MALTRSKSKVPASAATRAKRPSTTFQKRQQARKTTRELQRQRSAKVLRQPSELATGIPTSNLEAPSPTPKYLIYRPPTPPLPKRKPSDISVTSPGEILQVLGPENVHVHFHGAPLTLRGVQSPATSLLAAMASSPPMPSAHKVPKRRRSSQTKAQRCQAAATFYGMLLPIARALALSFTNFDDEGEMFEVWHLLEQALDKLVNIMGPHGTEHVSNCGERSNLRGWCAVQHATRTKA
ncbi:hypothetical protein B0A50_08205 [Salinomyces thailandicus]|uniref:Uncharacterized protein n=1 Tax=Salinomyces thailandicus TaxID=706561 RepID=A0A4U0TJW5_9PEZI|nr:hypothetical protein B0A50_08205 [Salinomyces thailandica]